MKNIVIKAEKVKKSFNENGREQSVLNGIDLEIYEGDYTVIMGRSGSGKSTLLYALSLLDQPTSGNVNILGVDSEKTDLQNIAELRQNEISFVFQNYNLLPDLTAFENVAYPAYLKMNKSAVNKKTDELLNKLDLADVRNNYPSNMSGGQLQRIALARALVKNPKIIFADEPTGALNSGAGKQVLDILSDVNDKGQTIVMVTHDIKACSRGNRVLYISDGLVSGELELGAYNSDNQKEREEKVFAFLTDHNW